MYEYNVQLYAWTVRCNLSAWIKFWSTISPVFFYSSSHLTKYLATDKVPWILCHPRNSCIFRGWNNELSNHIITIWWFSRNKIMGNWLTYPIWEMVEFVYIVFNYWHVLCPFSCLLFFLSIVLTKGLMNWLWKDHVWNRSEDLSITGFTISEHNVANHENVCNLRTVK